MNPTKYVIVESISFGRKYRAVPKLAFETKDAAQAYIVATYNERYRDRFHVEGRAVKADDTNARMHCQCCGRPILAKRGVIAHHGYERPGSGWQTQSCMGATELPWEVSRDMLGRLINSLRGRLQAMAQSRDDVAAERVEISHRYRAYNRTQRMREKETKVLSLTRATFDAIVAEDKARLPMDQILGGYYGEDATFDGYKRRDLDRRDGEILRIKEWLAECETRYAGWKQTHKREGDLWITL